jgi:glutamate-1-semialdehyde 2,1-aminomutase
MRLSATASALTITDRMTERARSVDARAATRPDILLPYDGYPQYPRYLQRAKGAYVWDVDGNRYIDFCLGYGPVILGHGDERVNGRAADATANGGCFAPLWSPLQIELAELLTSVIPGAEMCLMLKTGSDATSAAVRLARIYTGRSAVLRWGYNGWHDWSVEQPAGVPTSVRENSRAFDFNDLDALESLLSHGNDKVACVITMPFWDDQVEASHLSGIGEVARHNGALFILDEMRSGFRVALGGAQQYLHVQADLAAYGKAMGNGHPISALVGRRDILSKLSDTKISSTYFAEPGSMAAAIATIEILRDTDALDHVWRLGEMFQNELKTLTSRFGSSIEVVGYPPMPFMRFQSGDATTLYAVEQQFYSKTTADGLLLHPNHQWFLSAAHTTGDIYQALEVIELALDTL